MRGALGLLFNFRLITDLVDRVHGNEGLGIGLTEKCHQLAVFALIHDGDDLSSLHLVISACELVQGCTAMKIVEYKVHDLIELRRDDTNSALDIQTEDEVIDEHSGKISAEHAEDNHLGRIGNEHRGQRDGNSRDGDRTAELYSAILVDYLGYDIHTARRGVVREQNSHRDAYDEYVTEHVDQWILGERLEILGEDSLKNTEANRNRDRGVYRLGSELRADADKADDQKYHVDHKAEHRHGQGDKFVEHHRKCRATTDRDLAGKHKEEYSCGRERRAEGYDRKILQIAKQFSF